MGLPKGPTTGDMICWEGGPPFGFGDRGTSVLCWADAVLPTFLVTDFRNNEVAKFKNIDPREAK